MDVSQYRGFLLETAKTVLTADSPTGYTARGVATVEKIARDLGYKTYRTRRGALGITVDGRDNSRSVGLFAHLDTLGLLVRSVTERGGLLFAPIGLPVLPTMEGEYCRIYTRDGGVYSGTVLSLSPSYHVFEDANTRARNAENMYIRLDEAVSSREDVKKLGIRPGDFVCVDPKTTVTPSGFLKSRYLDDKASVAILLTALKCLKETRRKPAYRTEILFSVYEEVASGTCWIPDGVEEFLIVDMGCVGPNLSCTERQVSICAKDYGVPYDYDMTTRLIRLAEANGVDYAVDFYPYYASDAENVWNAGHDCPGALIGTGVHASHGMERTHVDGLENTLKLVLLYLDCG
jgi:putative aminopeptidase FrvX